jgi:hypothetical protein
MNYFLDDVKVFIVENLQALASVFKDNGRSWFSLTLLHDKILYMIYLEHEALRALNEWRMLF